MTNARAVSIPAELGDLFFYKDAIAAGMTDHRLYALRDAGEILALGGGLYRSADAPLANLDWIEITERVPRATLCLETALAHHGLSDVISAQTDIAIPRGAHRPKLNAAHRLHSFDTRTFDIGRETMNVGARQPLGIYSAERSLIDMIRLRYDQGPEQAWEALRRWLARRGNNPADLVTMAHQFNNAETPLRRALEVLR